MAEAVHGEESEAKDIKLFGTTIKLQGRRQVTLKEDEQKSTYYDHNHRSQETPVASKRPDKIIPCPRCNSTDTKFCYFNNYNANQPRHFCRGCHRYWTAGGALRNVPVGAGRRKSKLLPPQTSPAVDQRPSSTSGSNSNCFYEDSNSDTARPLGFDRIMMLNECHIRDGFQLQGFPAQHGRKRWNVDC